MPPGLAPGHADSVAELRASGVRGRLIPLDSPPRPVKRSTRRRQDAPDLPVDRSKEGRWGGCSPVITGPSTFLTLTLDSYGRVDNQGAAPDPDRYDYRRAARDAIRFPALVDRFWQNTRRCVGWDVQYFGTVEPQKRGTPHFHAALRGAIPRSELRAIRPRRRGRDRTTLLGHSSITVTTSTYVDVIEQVQHNALSKLDVLFEDDDQSGG